MEWLAENRTGAWGADPPDRETSNTILYAEAVRRVAAHNDVALVDLWEGKSRLDPARHLSDGLHLNNAGIVTVMVTVTFVVTVLVVPGYRTAYLSSL